MFPPGSFSEFRVHFDFPGTSIASSSSYSCNSVPRRSTTDFVQPLSAFCSPLRIQPETFMPFERLSRFSSSSPNESEISCCSKCCVPDCEFFSDHPSGIPFNSLGEEHNQNESNSHRKRDSPRSDSSIRTACFVFLDPSTIFVPDRFSRCTTISAWKLERRSCDSCSSCSLFCFLSPTF